MCQRHYQYILCYCTGIFVPYLFTPIITVIRVARLCTMQEIVVRLRVVYLVTWLTARDRRRRHVGALASVRRVLVIREFYSHPSALGRKI